MNVGVSSLRTGIFNVADMAIMLGVGILGIWLLIIMPSRRERA